MIRRLSFDLTGLPPEPEDVEAFLNDPAPDAYERLVDRLLASPHYGERWARHWLDLVRYAETAGHEFDYDILNAFRYRDYVIRAFNLDVPYDQFVVEHISGDAARNAAPAPGRRLQRVDRSGPGFIFLGEGTHSPVDVREEQMRRIDNQIDVFSKTFLGLTVACARCHDHKFDPITSQGLLRPGRIPAQLAASAGVHRPTRSHRQIRERLCDAQGDDRGDPARRTRSTAASRLREPGSAALDRSAERPPAVEPTATTGTLPTTIASGVRGLQPRSL